MDLSLNFSFSLTVNLKFYRVINKAHIDDIDIQSTLDLTGFFKAVFDPFETTVLVLIVSSRLLRDAARSDFFKLKEQLKPVLLVYQPML